MKTRFALRDAVRHRLENGLTVVTREDHSAPIVSSMIWYRVGSRIEVEGTTGVSHLLEHMMFKGSARYAKGEIDYITTRLGGANNAFTSRDYTGYYFSFASDRWAPALEIEADRMQNLLLDQEEFELERQVVLEELRMDLDSPWGSLRRAVETSAFHWHPYRHPIIGTERDLVGMRLEDVVAHYRAYYTPTNAVLVLVGDFRTRDVMKRVEALFSAIPARKLAKRRITREPARKKAVRLTLRQPTHVCRLIWAFPAPSVREPDHYVIELIDKILSEGKLARLYRRLVEEERLTSNISTEFDETYDPYLFFIRAELQPEADLVQVERVIRDELNRLRQRLVEEEEFERARNQALAQILADFETTLDQAVQIGLMETLGRFEYWNSYCDKLQSLTRQDIREVARKYLRTSQGTLGILVNGE
jgi:zinc protease